MNDIEDIVNLRLANAILRDTNERLVTMNAKLVGAVECARQFGKSSRPRVDRRWQEFVRLANSVTIEAVMTP